MSKNFFDTNILVYATDSHDPQKRERCRALLREAAANDNGVISTQVLQEYYVVATKKLGIDPIIARGLLESFENFEVVQVTPSMIREAIDLSVTSRISFWDGLIVSAAHRAACGRLYTEDLNPGQILKDVLIENPF